MQWPKHCRKRGDSMKKTWLQTWKENLKNRKKLRRYVRALIQLVFFVLMPSAFTAAFSGIKYIFTQIGAGAAIELTSFVSVLLVLILYTIVFGRFFCGFACAFGSLGDAVHALYVWVAKKLKKKPIRLSAKLNVGLQYVKYLVLLLIVALCFTGLYASIRGVSPWDVFSMIHAGNFRLSGYAVGIVLLVLILVGMCVQERFFAAICAQWGRSLPCCPPFRCFLCIESGQTAFQNARLAVSNVLLLLNCRPSENMKCPVSAFSVRSALIPARKGMYIAVSRN